MVTIFENGFDFEGIAALKEGFYDTLCEDAFENLMKEEFDGTKIIPTDVREEVVDLYYFSPKTIDPKTMQMCEKILEKIRISHTAELVDMRHLEEYNLGGELYVSIVYGDSANKLALEWAKEVHGLWCGSPTISESVDDDWRIFVE